jgi:hypothetical protein
MARSFNSRLAAQALAVAVAALLLAAGTATASSARVGHVASGRGGVARLSSAKALPAGSRCSTGRLRRLSRISAVRRRRRCLDSVRGSASRALQPLYWGATIGDHLTGEQAPWDMNAVSKFEEAAQKSASLVQLFQPFADCGRPPCSFYDFPETPLENVRQHGAIPVLSWSSQSIPSSLNEPDFQLSDVIEGRFDEFIREFADEAKAWGHPFFLRFNWEMNGDWFPWSESVNGNAAGQYVAAWRHVHDIFTAVGASNVSWVWCPFVDPPSTLQDVASLYPGDSYVDWTGLDGYNWGTNPASPRGWRSFDQLFGDSYAKIVDSVAPSKPMMLGEVGSSEYGGSKSAWVKDALAKVPTSYPQIRALLWFDKFDDNMDWPIETSTSATAAFAEGIQSPAYVGASYAGLGGDAIQPPG